MKIIVIGFLVKMTPLIERALKVPNDEVEKLEKEGTTRLQTNGVDTLLIRTTSIPMGSAVTQMMKTFNVSKQMTEMPRFWLLLSSKHIQFQ